jgi:replicative DNA helicase
MARTNGTRTNGRQQPSQREEQQQRLDIIDRTPPYDLQAEVAVLGSAVLLPECIDDVGLILRPEDFYDESNACLWGHLAAMHDESRRFDVVLLVNRLKAAGDFERVGGSKYISTIVNAVPTPAHAVHYADIVREKSLLRSVIVESITVLKDAYDPGAVGTEILARAEGAMARVSDATVRGNQTRSLGQMVMESMEALDARMAAGTSRLLRTGLECLNECMGLVAGGVTIVAGRPSMGKSALAMNIADYVSRHAGRVYIASLEMSGIELCDRLLVSRSRVPQHRMANGTITAEERQALVDVSAEISQLPIVLDDTPGMTLAQIAASVRREQRRGGLALAIIDYAQLIEPENPKENRTEQLGKISRGIKRLARQTRIPVMPLVQVNRDSEENSDLRPRLHQLKGCGDWEQDADSVVFVHRPKFYSNEAPPVGQGEEAEIIVAKNRNGPRDRHAVLFFKESMTWANRAGPRYAGEERETHF